jgi:hypothetical protein
MQYRTFDFSSAVKNVKIRIFKSIFYPVIMYECETLSFTLREEHRLKVFKERVLRRIFGPIRDQMVEVWRKLHNEELHNLCSPSGIIRAIDQGDEIGETCSTYVEEKRGIIGGIHRERDH